MAEFTCVQCGAIGDARAASVGEKGMLCPRCTPREAPGSSAGDQLLEMMFVGEAALASRAAMDALDAARMEDAMAGVGARGTTPDGGLHEKLAARGCACERYELDAGTLGRPGGGYGETWLMPRVAPLQATFGREGLRHRLGKLFARELQVGDRSFDGAVFIRTDTPEETAAWLASPDVRAAILAIVSTGGDVAIEGNMLDGRVLFGPGETTAADLLARLVRSLLR